MAIGSPGPVGRQNITRYGKAAYFMVATQREEGARFPSRAPSH
jgi:hypothetical protein